MNKNNFLNEKDTIRDAILILENKMSLIIPILDKKEKLLGIITDGDIRRAILKGFKIFGNIPSN